MRILHTADWHLCNRLGRIDRTADLQARVERLAAICDERGVNVLLIAGDLFDDRAEPDQITAAFNHLLQTFDPFFAKRGTILAVTGNHDRDAKINLVRTGMSLAAPFARSAAGTIEGGRFYLNNGRGFATLGGVQFVFAPYPFPSRYDLSDTEILAKEQLHQALHGKVAEWLAKLPGEALFDVTRPTVLLAHLHVRGSELHSVYRMNAADDVQFELADLHPQWAYIALGHVHKPQMLGGASHVRYPGSLDRLDISEAHEHGAVLFDVGPAGLLGEPQYIAIPSTPFHLVELKNLDEDLPLLAEKYADRETAIVKVEVQPHTSAISKDEAARQLRKLFPRLYDLKWIAAEQPESDESAPRVNARATLEETVRGYLAARPDVQADPDRAALLRLADGFLATP